MNYVKDIEIGHNQSIVSKQKNKIGFGLSIAILSIVALAIIGLFSGLHPSRYPIEPTTKFIYPGLYEKPYGFYFAYFGFVIGLVAAIVAAINIAHYALIRKGVINTIPKWLHITNLAVAVSGVFNFLFILIYMMPIVEVNKVYYFMYLVTGPNLLFNVIVPLLFMFMYIFCFKDYKLKLIENLYALIPLLLYSIVYGIVALTHISGGKIASDYDLYLFGNHHFWLIFVAFVVSMGASFGITIGMNKLNSISRFNRLKFVLAIDFFMVLTVPVVMGFMFHRNVTVDYIEEGLGQWQTVGLRFLFFTHLSNIFIFVSCLIQLIYIFKVLNGKLKCVPEWVQVFKLSTVGLITVTLAMQLVLALSKMMGAATFQEGIDLAYKACFTYHLIFEHFLTPLIALVSFMVLEHSKIKFKNLFYAAIPFGFYALVYAIVLYCHVNEQIRPSPLVTTWDIYGFSPFLKKLGGPYIYWFMPIFVYAFIFGLNWVIWFINRKVTFSSTKPESVFVELRSWKKNKAVVKAKPVKVIPPKVVKKVEPKVENKPVNLHVAGVAIIAGLIIFIGILALILSLIVK